MYEVFINNRPLVIDKKGAFSTPNAMTYSLNFPWRKVVNKLVRGEVSSCYVQAADLELAWQAFKQNFTVIEAAGGVVMKNQEMLFIYRNGKWDLPKGKLEINESIPLCAVREVEEECVVEVEFLTWPFVFVTQGGSPSKSEYSAYAIVHFGTVGRHYSLFERSKAPPSRS